MEPESWRRFNFADDEVLVDVGGYTVRECLDKHGAPAIELRFELPPPAVSVDQLDVHIDARPPSGTGPTAPPFTSWLTVELPPSDAKRRRRWEVELPCLVDGDRMRAKLRGGKRVLTVTAPPAALEGEGHGEGGRGGDDQGGGTVLLGANATSDGGGGSGAAEAAAAAAAAAHAAARAKTVAAGAKAAKITAKAKAKAAAAAAAESAAAAAAAAAAHAAAVADAKASATAKEAAEQPVAEQAAAGSGAKGAEAAALKADGNAQVRAGDYAAAADCYTAAIAALGAAADGSKCAFWDGGELAALHVNRALCRLRGGDAPGSEADCCAALQHNPGFLRAHERLGAALLAQGRLSGAAAAYRAGLALEVGHRGCAAGLRRATADGEPPPDAENPAPAPAAEPEPAELKKSGAVTIGDAVGDARLAAAAGLGKFPVGLVSLPDRGRGVVAGPKGLAAGELALSAGPAAAVVKDKYSGKVCEFCLGPLDALSHLALVMGKCEGCNCVQYCSKQCLSRDQSDHAAECPTLAGWARKHATGGKVPPEKQGVRLLLRLLAAVRADKDTAALVGALEHQPGAENKPALRQMGEALSLMLGYKKPPDPAQVARLVSKVQRNSHGLTDQANCNLGTGLYPAASFFNHCAFQPVTHTCC